MSLNEIFEIRDDEINVDEIIEKIQKSILERIKSGIIISEPDGLPFFHDERGPTDEMKKNLNNYEIMHNDYSITSHRRYIGKYLVMGRQIVNGEVRRYCDPVFYKQSQLNLDFDNTLKETIDLIKRLELRVDALESYIENYLEYKVRSALSAIEMDIDRKAWLSKVFDENILKKANTNNNLASESCENSVEDSINYFVFSEEIGKKWEKIGGKSDGLSPIFNDFIPFFNRCKNVIDIGCGRGYLLQHFTNNDIGCYGIDLNENNIHFCKKYGLNVIQSDATLHLQALDDKSLDGATINQVLEHMTIDKICDMIKLIYDKLQYGSYIIITIPNVSSMLVSTNLFYLDPTHLTHLHPEVLKFILKSQNFREIQERFYQPVHDDMKLRSINVQNDGNSIMEEIRKTCNTNTEKLNNLLFGDRDYCIIGKK